jgi:hypothetical protein
MAESEAVPQHNGEAPAPVVRDFTWKVELVTGPAGSRVRVTFTTKFGTQQFVFDGPAATELSTAIGAAAHDASTGLSIVRRNPGIFPPGR